MALTNLHATLTYDTDAKTLELEVAVETAPPGLSAIDLTAFLPAAASPAKSFWQVMTDEAAYPLRLETIYRDGPLHVSVLATAGASAAKVEVDATSPDGKAHVEGLTGAPIDVTLTPA